MIVRTVKRTAYIIITVCRATTCY